MLLLGMVIPVYNFHILKNNLNKCSGKCIVFVKYRGCVSVSQRIFSSTLIYWVGRGHVRKYPLSKSGKGNDRFLKRFKVVV